MKIRQLHGLSALHGKNKIPQLRKILSEVLQFFHNVITTFS